MILFVLYDRPTDKTMSSIISRILFYFCTLENEKQKALYRKTLLIKVSLIFMNITTEEI